MPTYIQVVCVLNSLLPLSAVNALWVLMLFLPIEKIHYTLCSFICYNNALPFERKPTLEQTLTSVGLECSMATQKFCEQQWVS